MIYDAIDPFPASFPNHIRVGGMMRQSILFEIIK